jgi:hypothetical protein
MFPNFRTAFAADVPALWSTMNLPSHQRGLTVDNDRNDLNDSREVQVVCSFATPKKSLRFFVLPSVSPARIQRLL